MGDWFKSVMQWSPRFLHSDIAVIAKIESVKSLKNLEEIIQASDGVMVARGDLGAQIHLEQVSLAQEKIVQLCRLLNKPVIIASQLLESMIEYPIPTGAEVADVSEAVRQQADALMLSGESAMGQYPEKALSVLKNVSSQIEKWWREEKHHEALKLTDVIISSLPYSISKELWEKALSVLKNVSSQIEKWWREEKHHEALKLADVIISSLPYSISKELCNAAAAMANNLGADAQFVYTKTGHLATLLSQCRPDYPIFAFTPSTSVRRCLNLLWGLIPFRVGFSDDTESNLSKTFSLLKARGMIKSGEVIISVSDKLQSIQVTNVP